MSRSLPLSTVLIEEFAAAGPAESAAAAEFDLEKRRAAVRRKHAPDRDLSRCPAKLEGVVERELLSEVFDFLHRNRKRAALCLSGGGIRSATFGLGVLQGLARQGLLRQFDFLSTVSGGGYVGSWLSAWIHRLHDPSQADPAAAVARLEHELLARPRSPLEPEPGPVRHLRGHSRYMSPRQGLVSVDTWTLVATYLRNLLLNWLIFLPLVAAVLMLPRLSIFLIRLPDQPFFAAHLTLFQTLAYAVALIAGWLAIGYVAPSRPSLVGLSKLDEGAQTLRGYFVRCHLPLLVMAIALTSSWAWSVQLLHQPPGWKTLTGLGVLLHLGGLFCSWIWTPARFRLGELAAVVISGAAGGFILWLGGSWLFADLAGATEKIIYACFATPVLLFCFLLATFIFVGTSPHYTSDADREWMARCGGWLLVTVVLRAAMAMVVFLGPIYFLQLVQSQSILPWIASFVGGVSGLVTLILGVSAKTGLLGIGGGDQKSEAERSRGGLLDLALALAAPVFIVFLMVGISLATTFLVAWLARLGYEDVPHFQPGDPPEQLHVILVASPLWAILAVGLAFYLISRVAGHAININRFSLHATYRDRLIRAYLGASRGDLRKPHPFIDFDEADNLPMYRLAGQRPLHLVNIALNQVGSAASASRDRKACSFTVSPLHAGHFGLGYRAAAGYGGRDGISLGTALAISGAAASPNMGYHSSPVITFLMAMFNLRLGWWLGNPGPAGERSCQHASPRDATRCLGSEALGLTDESSEYVYLSDGGHFENLGLYEMVLRRCAYIVVSDAGHDPEFGFEDLGRAITQIRIDLGIPITFAETIALRPYKAGGEAAGAGAQRACCALGRIHYSRVDGNDPADDGYLLYLKPCLDGSEPVNVYQYAHENPLFPHEPTADQFYSETQFESYRALGEHLVGRVFGGGPVPGWTELFAEEGARFRRAA